MGKSRALLILGTICLSISSLVAPNRAMGLQLQLGGSSTSSSSSSDALGSASGQSSSGGTLRIPSATTGSVPAAPSDQGPYIDTAGMQNRNNMTEAERQAYDRQRRWRQVLAQPETDFQKMARVSLGERLQVYGRKLFLEGPSSFSPVEQAPVTPDYVIGPGDEILVRTWGQISFNDRVTVDRSGSVYIPRVGSIHVAGLQFSALEKQMRTSISRVFRNFDISVNMGQLHSIQIFIVGQANMPGSYTVSSLSTLVSAVFVAGGPSNQGSMRHVQLRRDGQTISEFDFYDLMSRGDKSKDVHLISGDVIYIPPVGPQVAFGGSVKNPALYELKDEATSIGQLLEIAGGLSTTASRADILIERVVDHHERQAMRVAADASGLATQLHDGDILRFSSLTQRFEQSVTIRGNLATPGRFAWHQGMRLSELIPERESLLTNNYWQRRNSLGLPAPMFEPFKKAQTWPDPSVAGSGNPSGTVPTQKQPQAEADENSPYYSLPEEKPNPEDSLALDRQIVTTVQPQPQSQVQQIPGQSQQSQQLVGSSVASVAQGPSSKADADMKKVEIKMSAPEIDWSYAVIERIDKKTLKTELLPFNLGKLVLDHDESQNLELQPGDIVTIMSQADMHVPMDEQTKLVRLEGELVSAGVYSALPGETLRQLVLRAGGLTRNAYLYGSQFTRESTRRIQQQRLDEYTARLSAELQRSAISQMTSGVTGTDSGAFAAMQTTEQQMLQRLGQIKATGRIVLELSPNSADVNNIPDIPLENGDRFIIPSKPSSVSVVGAVYDQNSFIYSPHRNVGDYLKMSGGPNRSADRRHAFVIRADGSVYSHDASKGFWGSEFSGAHVYPGDTIVVPEKVFSPPIMRQVLQWSQFVSSLAMGVATIGILANQ